MDYYVYFHRFNDTGEIFYVGKGIKRRYLSKSRSELWKTIVKDRPYTAEIYKGNLTEEQAYELEIELIKEYSPIGNVQPGGPIGGITSSEYNLWFYRNTDAGKEKRKKMSQRMKEDNPMKKKYLRERQSTINKGSNNFYHKSSQESKDKHRRNVSKSKMGAGNPRAKKVEYIPNGKVYGSYLECVREEELENSKYYYFKNNIVRLYGE